MFWPFHRYFVRYIFTEKTRQRPLFIGLMGLAISSFALLVLQGTMGGLQHNLIERSYLAEGTSYLELENLGQDKAEQIQKYLYAQKIQSYPEYEIELLMKWDGQIAPIIVHGIDLQWALNKNDLKNIKIPMIQNELNSGLILGRDVGGKMILPKGAEVSLISPAHTNSFLGEVPRQVSTVVSKFVTTGVPQVDLFHATSRLSLVQNLIREKTINRIRIFSKHDWSKLENDLKDKFPNLNFKLIPWETKNASLVFALKLENVVMTFLFVIMTFLVSISITSGLLIFFDKIKLDLVGFWILGASPSTLNKSSKVLLHILNLGAVLLGLIFGFIFLYVLDKYMPDLMPSIFVERRIPVHLGLRSILVSFFIPMIMASVFSLVSLGEQGNDEANYLQRIRTIT